MDPTFLCSPTTLETGYTPGGGVFSWNASNSTITGAAGLRSPVVPGGACSERAEPEDRDPAPPHLCPRDHPAK